MEEIFKDIDWFTGELACLNGLYSISSLGRVYSKISDIILKPSMARDYDLVILQKLGIRKGMKVHRLVALAFLPNPDNLPVVNHIDGDKTNNRLSNLEWCTTQQNVQHAVDTGLMVGLSGLNGTMSKLTKEEVIEIYTNTDTPSIELAEKYGIELSNIQNILNGTAYKDVTKNLPLPNRSSVPRRKRTSLSVEDAKEIYLNSSTYTELALKYGVGRSTIGRIKRAEGKWVLLKTICE